MINIENTEVFGWEAAIRGMRNPLNSWEKSDSQICGSYEVLCYCDLNDVCMFRDECGDFPYTTNTDQFVHIGPNDLQLMKKLRNAGPDHGKFMRMITVYVDITAPLYWLAELDTYKIGTVRNSCSFMHKGLSKEITIDDFSIKNEKVYEAIRPLEKRMHNLVYPYETDDFKRFEDDQKRTYRVYRNGKIIREAFSYTDNYGTGRTRHFEEGEACIYQNNDGYYDMKLSGRGGGRMLVHRLVAQLWCDRPAGANQVNHIDGNKGNNSAENLEWVTASENMQKSVKNGLHDNLNSLHRKYLSWRNSTTVMAPQERGFFKLDCEEGLTHRQLAEKWGLTPSQANNIRYTIMHSENEDLFEECYIWDSIIFNINLLRELYLETRDETIFQEIRSLLPQGYMQRSTFMFNYEVLRNIYHARKNHRLDEWHDFCEWVETLPYSELITGKEQIFEYADQPGLDDAAAPVFALGC